MSSIQTPIGGVALGCILLFSCSAPEKHLESAEPLPSSALLQEKGISAMTEHVIHTPEEWRTLLTPDQYRVLREKDTEQAFTGAYWNTKKPGVYHCAGCGEVLFSSEDKFDSGCGWPSFSQPIKETELQRQQDTTYGMVRTEVLCPRCGGHLGHVFNDGPQPTGLRYCINSAALRLEKKP